MLYFKYMNDGTFSNEATILWSAIRHGIQREILTAVFCAKCMTSVRIINFRGSPLKNGDLHLKGSCAVCGEDVARVLETSEIVYQNN